MITSFRLLNPKLTKRAHLKLLSFNKLFEQFIIFVLICVYFVFLTRLPLMINHTATQAISFVTFITSEVFAVSIRLIDKGVLTVCGGAPGNVLLEAQGFLERVLLVLVPVGWREELMEVSWGKF